MTMPMNITKAIVISVLPLLMGCPGYAELPLPLREGAQLTITSAQRFPAAAGRVELAISLPDDVQGPLVIVGPPESIRLDATVLSWAQGPCDPDDAPEGDLIVCASVYTDSQKVSPLAFTIVVESRGDGRRFTAFGGAPQ